MTTNQLPLQERTRLARLLAHLRPDWDLPGIDATLITLDQQSPNPAATCRIAILWATRADSRVPAGMLNPQLRDYPEPTRTGQPSTPRPTGEPCPTHGTGLRRADGELACCWSERVTAHSLPPARERRPPPADFRARVAAARSFEQQTSRTPGVTEGDTNE